MASTRTWSDPPAVRRSRSARSCTYLSRETIGMTDVACLAATIAAVADVTMNINLAPDELDRDFVEALVRPSAQRYSIATVRPSIQPSSCNRRTKAATHWPWDE